MIDTINATLNCAPKGFDCVDVGIASDILLGCVLDDFVGVSQLGNMIVARQLVSEDCTVVGYILPNHRQKCPSLNIRDYLSDCVPLTLGHSHYSRLTCCAPAPFPCVLPTDVGLIYFDLSSKRINVFAHEFANLFEYTPSRFVSDTQFPLELLCGDTCLGRSHQEDSVKPRAERSI